MLWRFNKVYDAKLQLADHRQPVKYPMRLPAAPAEGKVNQRALYILPAEPAKAEPAAV
jgi:hypothetical protein